jgi:hypothetical protein
VDFGSVLPSGATAKGKRRTGAACSENHLDLERQPREALLTDKALDFRRAHGDVFLDGDYIPVKAAGPKQDNLVTFCRRHGSTWALTVAPRWTTRLTSKFRFPLGERAWLDTSLQLPEGAPVSWRDVLWRNGGKPTPCGRAGGSPSSRPVAPVSGGIVDQHMNNLTFSSATRLAVAIRARTSSQS